MSVDKEINISRTCYLNPRLLAGMIGINRSREDGLCSGVLGHNPGTGGGQLQQKRIGVDPCDRDPRSIDRGPARFWPKLFVDQGRGPFLGAFYNAPVGSDSPMLVRYQ